MVPLLKQRRKVGVFGGVLGEEPLYYLFTRQAGADRQPNLGYLTSSADSFGGTIM